MRDSIQYNLGSDIGQIQRNVEYEARSRDYKKSIIMDELKNFETTLQAPGQGVPNL